VRGIPSPFIKIYERGRDTPHPSLLPATARKDFLDGVLATCPLTVVLQRLDARGNRELRTYNWVAFVQYRIVQRVFE
jgi:hypothetical protein